MARNLTQLVEAKKISKSGADWLRTALDPFHDYAEDFEGFPDIISAKSKVQMATATCSIASPDTNAYSARVWLNPAYCHINTPSFAAVTAQADSYVDIDVGTNYGPAGLIIADAWNAGDPNIDVPGANFGRTAAGTAPLNTPGRLIAVGFEIHNTTPVLYQSGVITCSRSNTYLREESREVWDSTSLTPAVASVQRVQQISLPPKTATDALIAPGSTQWHASKGCYMVAHMMQPDIPVKWNECKFMIYGQGLSSPAVETTLVGAAGHVVPYLDTVRHAFDMPYALLTDLSGESTFTVTVRAFYEYFPIDPNILRMATPSPALDHKALALYGAVAAHLPMAVPVGMNAKGDYFRMVMQAISAALQILSPAAAVIHPSGPMIAGIAAQVARVLATKPSGNNTNKAGRKKPNLPPKKKKTTSGWNSLGGIPRS
jgi:hypothetical protein